MESGITTPNKYRLRRALAGALLAPAALSLTGCGEQDTHWNATVVCDEGTTGLNIESVENYDSDVLEDAVRVSCEQNDGTTEPPRSIEITSGFSDEATVDNNTVATSGTAFSVAISGTYDSGDLMFPYEPPAASTAIDETTGTISIDYSHDYANPIDQITDVTVKPKS